MHPSLDDDRSPAGTQDHAAGAARRRRRGGAAAAALLGAGTLAAALAGQQQASAAPAGAPAVLAARTPDGSTMAMTVLVGGQPARGDAGTTFDVTSYSWKVLPSTGSPAARRLGITVTHTVGTGSPALMTAYNGRTEVQVRVTLTRAVARPVTYATYTLGGCLVTGLKHTAAATADPQDQATFTCRTSQLDTRVVNPDGSLGPVVTATLDSRTMPGS
ncbi:type VI secretion system tube protein Hcp [Kineosporia sp. A_224]|uniref:type VI secretion system tube protein Hcp n=1 Tax=Kineosporia sp. A_224 TaxID=1962180 RepID=UPI000B4BF3F5|nr:type VI secretion system tube protein Hcp [Kineosporia sp. A_224]